MQIIHRLDDFLYTIFPELAGADDTAIIATLEKYYTYAAYKPSITIDKDWVTINIDTKSIISQEADYKKTVSLCEKGRYAEAKPILHKLIETNPGNSEYHRIMGQILSDEGDQEEAINCLIDALRWDSKNGWALVMMGNIFAKYKNDVPTAMKYYDQAVIANPKDNIAINNIGANLMQQGKIEEAKKYFWEAVKINPEYPNTHFALGMVAELENDLHSAFYSTTQAIKLNKNKDGLYQNSVKQLFEIAERIIESEAGKKIYTEYRHKLEFDGGTEIDIVEDANIPTAAKFEFAENYSRAKHLVKLNPKYRAAEHLVMHELVHLDLVIQARKDNLNQLFISTQQHKSQFIKDQESTQRKFRKMGIPEDATFKYLDSLFDGLNLQIYNAPIDLFIEDFLYNEFSELRPYQFISVYNVIQQGLKAVTDKKSIDFSPPEILSVSKVYNLVHALQFKELFGIDIVKDYRATALELRKAQEFYQEYLQYKENKEPAEEYEMVQHWAEDLKVDRNFELIDENEYRTKRTDLDNFLDSVEKDPFDIESKDPFKEREMEKFQKAQKEIGLNMAVVMFMVGAMEYFDGMPKEKIKEIAFEIAMQGTQGYSPEKDDYRINALPGKLFSGYHILAYYYVSWMLAIPEMLPQLKLPYDDEYKLALTMHKPK